MVFNRFRILLSTFIRRSNFFYLFLLPNCRALFLNKITFKKRLEIQQHTVCTGKGYVEIGYDCLFGYKIGGFNRRGSIEIQARYDNSRIKIGDNVKTNNNIFLLAANYIEIGDNSLIGQNVTVMDHEAHGIEPHNRNQLGEIGKVIIGLNVWIGNNVVILKNSEIGDNSIVATGAVVSGKFPPNVIIGGVPAKILKSI